MAKIDRTELNDLLTTYLAEKGWHADTEEDYARLNDLTHEVGDKLDAFLDQENEGQ